jgi:GT2 family glycosyltransferase
VKAPIRESIGFGGPIQISVIVPVGRVDEPLRLQLAALGSQIDAPSWELILSLNSPLAFGVEVPDSIPQWKLIDSTEMAGPSHARNAGVTHARSDRLAFCDADDVVDPRWLREIASSLETADLVGGVYEERTLNPRSYKWRSAEESTGAPVFDFLPSGWGGNLGFRRSAFLSVGGFPADLRSGEDITLCWRAQQNGSTFRFNPNAVVHYRHRTTIRATMRQHFLYSRELVRVIELFRPEGVSVSPLRMALTTPLSYLREAARRRTFSAGRLARDLSISAGLIYGISRHRIALITNPFAAKGKPA